MDTLLSHEQSYLQRVVVFGDVQNFARLPVLPHDQVFRGHVRHRCALVVHHAGIHDALVHLR
jgi:hypothetical protein